MWELTKMTYASFDINSILIGKTNNYTQIVIDMTTSTNYGPSDYVSGYTIKQIEDPLVNNDDTWNDWRDAIKAIDPSNPTKSGLDALFAYWKP